MVSSNMWLLFWKLPLGGHPLYWPDTIKGQPELQKIPSEDPETAGGSPSADASDTTPCCFAYISGRLPFTHIQEYFYTSSKCSMPAVVFVTRKHRQVCANPQKKWVREYINSLEMS
ncbi:C-C motif chemokine 5 [Vulpes lagopus]